MSSPINNTSRLSGRDPHSRPGSIHLFLSRILVVAILAALVGRCIAAPDTAFSGSDNAADYLAAATKADKSGDFVSVVVYADAALVIAPGNKEAEKLISDARSRLTTDTLRGLAHYYSGVGLWNCGKSDDAIKEWQFARSLAPEADCIKTALADAASPSPKPASAEQNSSASLAQEPAPDDFSDLVVEKLGWQFTSWPGEGAGGHKAAYVSGVIRNAGTSVYDSIMVEIGITDLKKGTKLNTSPVAYGYNLAPGERWAFRGDPPICVFVSRDNPMDRQYMGQIDRISGRRRPSK